MKRIFTFLFLLFSGLVFPQASFLGKVIDDNGDAISYVHVFLLQHQNIGTVTNEAGEFAFYPEEKFYKDDSLVVSMLGFETVYFPMNKIEGTSQLIKLKRSIVPFDEIIIHSQEYLKYLLISAIENVENNYPTAKHQLHAYYYDYSVTDSVISEVIELDLAINMDRYNSNKIDFDVYNLAMRKSEDNRNLPPRLVSSTNRVHQTLNRIPFIRKSFDAFFKKNDTYKKWISDLKNMNLEMYDQVIQDNDTLITLKCNSNFFMKKGLENESYLFSLITINKSDFGIVKLLYGDIWTSENSFDEVAFRKINGKYFPSYIKLNNEYHFDNKTRHHFNSSNIIFYNTQMDRDSFIKTKRKQKLKKDKNIRDIKFVEDAEFWSKYTLTQELTVSEIMKSNLQRINNVRSRNNKE